MFTSRNITLLVAILATLTIGHAEHVSQTVGEAIAQVSCNNQRVSSPKLEISSVTHEVTEPAVGTPKETTCNCEDKKPAGEAVAEVSRSQTAHVQVTAQPEKIQVRACLDPKAAELLGVEKPPLVLTKTATKSADIEESSESVPKCTPTASVAEVKTEEKAVEEKAVEEKAVETKALEEKVEKKDAIAEKESTKPSKKVKIDKKRSKRDAKGKSSKNKGSSKGKQHKESQKKQKGKNKK